MHLTFITHPHNTEVHLVMMIGERSEVHEVMWMGEKSEVSCGWVRKVKCYMNGWEEWSARSMGEKSEVLCGSVRKVRCISMTSCTSPSSLNDRDGCLSLQISRLLCWNTSLELPHHCIAHVTCSNTPLFAYDLALTVQSLTFTQP